MLVRMGWVRDIDAGAILVPGRAQLSNTRAVVHLDRQKNSIREPTRRGLSMHDRPARPSPRSRYSTVAALPSARKKDENSSFWPLVGPHFGAHSFGKAARCKAWLGNGSDCPMLQYVLVSVCCVSLRRRHLLHLLACPGLATLPTCCVVWRLAIFQWAPGSVWRGVGSLAATAVVVCSSWLFLSASFRCGVRCGSRSDLIR